jgi:hypothetical protein
MDDPDSFEILKIYSNDDERLHKIGQILSTPKSRKIYGLLVTHELNATEIGRIINNEKIPKLPNLIFHLNKMVDVGLLTTAKKRQLVGGHALTYYKATSLILIVPSHQYEKAIKSKTLKNIIDKIFKLKK